MKSFYDKLTKIHEDNSLRKRIQYRSTRRINKQILKNYNEDSTFRKHKKYISNKNRKSPYHLYASGYIKNLLIKRSNKDWEETKSILIDKIKNSEGKFNVNYNYLFSITESFANYFNYHRFMVKDNILINKFDKSL
jgi:hypothetical protein